MADGREVFVGRREALAALRTELGLGLGGPRVVWVEGEAGVGKTSLVRAALAQAGRRRVVWAAGVEEEQGMAFGVLGHLVRDLGAGPGAPLWAVRAATDALAAGADLLTAVAEVPAPVVLVVDDLHWVDEESARALLFALRRLTSEPVVVAVTSRPGALAGLAGWERLLGGSSRARRVELGGLDVAELVELAEATGAGWLDPETAQELRDHTGGHPLHARALLAEVGVAGLTGRAGVLPAPRALATLIVARLGGLSSEARRLVTAAAVLGSRSRLADVAAVAGLGDPLPAADAAIRANLLECSEPQAVGFPHPLVRAAVYHDLALASRRALHLAAAEVTTGAAALEHRAAAAFGPDPLLVEELDRLAAEESDQGRAAAAARHWRQAAALSGGPAERDRRVLRAVEGVFGAGLLAQARALRPEVERCGGSGYRDYVLGCLAFAEGRLADAEKLGSDGLDRLTPGDIATRAAAATGFVRMLLGDWEGSVRACGAGLEGDAGWAGGFARYALALSYAYLGRLDNLGRLRHRLDFEMSQGQLPRSEALSLRGVIKLWMGEPHQAKADLAEAVERGRAGERSWLLVATLSALAEANFLLGHWGDAIVAAELGVSLSRDGQRLVGAQQAYSTAAVLHARCGRFDLAQAHIDEFAAIEPLLPWWGSTPLLALCRAVLAEARGDPAAMSRAVAPLLDGVASDLHRGLPTWPAAAVVIDALLGAGDTAGAEARLDALDDLVHALQVTSMAADLARLRGRLAEVRGDLSRAEAHYRSGCTAPNAHPYAAARAHLALGRLQRLTGRGEEAAQPLLLAHEQLSALGAAPDLRLCELELAACGQRVAHTGALGRLGLTAAELSVANLVAQRLTNREVATRLYISTKTVEYHLGHVYAKLNITSRRQLADRLAQV